MKVVLFCGGLGTRLREHSSTIPKPLVSIGVRPILWHLMRYYAHFGHKDFILCLGYRGDLIREYFLDYRETMSNDFVMLDGGRKVELMNSDIADWRITFVDTGLHSNIGQRLLRVKRYLDGEDEFMANYSDGLTNLPLDRHVDFFRRNGGVATIMTVPAPHTFHLVKSSEDGKVGSIGPVSQSEVWLNAGFMCLRKEIFEYIEEGEELVEKPFDRLIAEGRLYANRYTGFWQQMDTFRDKILYDRLEGSGDCPWKVWEK